MGFDGRETGCRGTDRNHGPSKLGTPLGFLRDVVQTVDRCTDEQDHPNGFFNLFTASVSISAMTSAMDLPRNDASMAMRHTTSFGRLSGRTFWRPLKVRI